MFDVVVLGGGVVGLACAHALTLANYKVAVVERESDLLGHASGGNSGIVCTGVDAQCGSLERALIRDSISMIRPYCQQHNIPIRPCGSLVCLWKEQEEDRGSSSSSNDDNQLQQQSLDALLQNVLDESHDAGDNDATILTPSQVSSIEPNLASSSSEHSSSSSSSLMHGAVHIPGEIVVDPWLYSISLACHAKENGCTIYTNYEVDIDNITTTTLEDDDDNSDGSVAIWTIPRKKQTQHDDNDDDNNDDDNAPPSEIKARLAINAAGLWAESIEERIRNNLNNNQHKSNNGSNSKNDNNNTSSSTLCCPWQARPRRGQYRIYRSTPSTTIEHPIQPVPTPRTKGIFVFSNIFQNLIVVGPTAIDQVSKTDRSIDEHVATHLDIVVQRTIPSINPKLQYVGDYVGIRPGTQHRDYQIHGMPRMKWIAVAGIRSTGLTASLGIGNYVTRLVQMMIRPQSTTTTQTDTTITVTTPMPSINELIESYKYHHQSDKGRGHGYVTIHGHDYKITHPLSRMSFEELVRSSLSSSSSAAATYER